MAFEKGNTHGQGRPPGSKNRVGQTLRQTITDFLDENFDRIRADFDELKPRERVRLYIDFLQYGLPRLQSVEFSDEFFNEFDKLSDEDIDRLIERFTQVQNH